MDAAGANALQDDGGGPAASFDGAVFYKVDGGTKLRFMASNAADQESEDLVDFVSGGELTVGFLAMPNADGTLLTLVPYVNDQRLTPLSISPLPVPFATSGAHRRPTSDGDRSRVLS